MSAIMFPKAPTATFTYNEILIRYAEKIPEVFSSLTPEERIFVYYLYRANIPGERICADQLHRHSLELIDLFAYIVKQKDVLLNFVEIPDVDLKTFVTECETYLVYLICNGGPYYNSEHANSKRTPEKLGMKQLTLKNLQLVLDRVNRKFDMKRLEKTIFDQNYEPTLTVQDSIKDSAVNMYSPDFTDEDFKKMAHTDQTAINMYFYKDGETPKCMKYSIEGKYSSELKTSVYWLSQAVEHARKHPKLFDENLVQSIELMIEFLKTGDEDVFKKQSAIWLKSKSKIDYCFGFQEVYDDPKAFRGTFQGEVTVRTIDMEKVNALIPTIEALLPFPKEYLRDFKEKTPVMNASMNLRMYGSGHLGMFSRTAAYCLPNYEEIREQVGSKQIIYPSDKSIGMMINRKLSEQLFQLKTDIIWHQKHDPEYNLNDDIWNLSCILHETIGHGSGKAHEHTFVEGDNMMIDGKEYKLGDTVKVTSSNWPQFMFGLQNAIEEMRAEIIALYVSVHHLHDLLRVGLMEKWAKFMTQKEMIEQFILGMARTGLRRYLQQADGATEITGAHALANCTIFHYLVFHGGVEVVEETVMVDDKGEKRKVVGLRIKDLAVATVLVKSLMVQVQTIKSTANGRLAKKLIETYGKKIFYPEHMKTMKENQKLVVGNIKGSASLYPVYLPVKNEKGEMIDCTYEWPKDIFDMHHKLC
jgi:dipeptidyl-peptidase-3